MKNPTNMLIIATLSVLVVLTGCNSKSEEQVIQEAKDIAEKTFSSPQTNTSNTALEHLSLYLPQHLEVEEVDENNIILSDAKQTYIVFYNQLEEPTSKFNYQIAENNDALLLESFQNAERFGYIQILTEDHEQYEIQIGVGGAKITTYTTKNKMVAHAKELMEIALSIESLNNQDD